MQTYTVRGFWPFPLDMLRHDQSNPVSPEDAAMIGRLSNDYAPDKAAFEPVNVTLESCCNPNSARWESFGWEVTTDREYKFIRDLCAKAEEEERRFESVMAKLSPEDQAVIMRRMPFHG